jgi:ABC-2 type transport system permease protein
MNIKKSLLPIITYVPIDVKRLFRDKVGIFFVFLFPLIFLAVFGTIFRGNNDVSFRVALLNNSDTEFATQFTQGLKDNKLFKIDSKVNDVEAGKEKMSRGQLDAIIVLPSGFGGIADGALYPNGQAQVIYSQSNQTAGQALGSIMDGVFKGINAQYVPVDVPFTVTTESTATAGLTQFDYTFSGVLGFTLLSLGIFGPTSVFPRLKQRGVLRRYNSTTIKVWQYFVANVLSNAFIGLLSATLMFITALTVFGLNMRGNYFNMAVVVILGVIMLFGIGLAIGGWAKNENQAAPLAQIATLPMMFLSGVFFPTFIMPEFLQNITRFIPLTPVVDSIRLILTENASLIELAPQLTVVGGWTVVIYVLAFRIFRWE